MTVMRVKIERRVEGRESLGTNEVVIKWVGRFWRGGDADDEPTATAAIPDSPARPSHHAEDQNPGTRSKRYNQGGRRRGEEA